MQRVLLAGLLLITTPAVAQSPTPVPAAEPELPAELRLTRENLLLQARVAELEAQLAQLRAQVLAERINAQVEPLITRLQHAAPGYDVHPQTLALTRKVTTASPPPAPTASPQPRP